MTGWSNASRAACRNWRSSPQQARRGRTRGRPPPDGRSPAGAPGSGACVPSPAHAQQRGARQGALEREVRARLARAGAADGHPRAHARVAADGRVDRPGPRGRAALDERQVFAFDLPLRRARPAAGGGPRSLRATTIRPEVSRSSRCTIPARSGSPPPASLAAEQLRERVLAVAAARGARPGPGPCRPRSGARPRGRSRSSRLRSLLGRPSRRAMRSTTITSARIPSVIEASARLKGGQPSGSLTKSVTEPPRMRSITLPSAPPSSIPVGQPDQRLVEVPREVDEQHAAARPRSGSSRRRGCPGRKPKATPWLRVLTSSTPGRKRCSSPGMIELRTRCLVSWSRATTSSATPRAASHVRDGLRLRALTGSGCIRYREREARFGQRARPVDADPHRAMSPSRSVKTVAPSCAIGVPLRFARPLSRQSETHAVPAGVEPVLDLQPVLVPGAHPLGDRWRTPSGPCHTLPSGLVLTSNSMSALHATAARSAGRRSSRPRSSGGRSRRSPATSSPSIPESPAVSRG